ANIVCLRKVSNFILTEEQQAKVKYYETKPLDTARLDYTHAKWHGYTFNPHIASIEAWKKTGGFYKFKKERDVSIFFRSQGKYNLFRSEERRVGKECRYGRESTDREATSGR